MQQNLAMTVIGQDRPGLVEAVAELVAGHGGNWLESRMSRLGGQFAGILRVSVPAEMQEALANDLKRLDARGLTVVVTPDALPDAAGGPLYLFELTGQDRPGIVRQISSALASFAINVEELNTEVLSAAMSGESMFRAEAKLRLPTGCDAEQVRARLERIATDLIVDVSLAPL